jgi:thioredoxin:protein disulfide reductase
MLAVAVWMISRVVPEWVTAALWMIPFAALCVVLVRAPVKNRGARYGARAAAALVGVMVVLTGAGAWKAMMAAQTGQSAAHVELPFLRIKSVDDLTAQVTKANAAGKSVMLDFYADWCTSCKEMERDTFPEAEVRAALSNTVWLQADVTANDEVDKALMQHFGIFGPPTIVFFGTDGVERRKFRQAGFMKASEFAPLVTNAFK